MKKRFSVLLMAVTLALPFSASAEGIFTEIDDNYAAYAMEEAASPEVYFEEAASEPMIFEEVFTEVPEMVYEEVAPVTEAVFVEEEVFENEAASLNGFRTIKGQTRYMRNGVWVTGLQYIDGTYYLFGDDAIMLKGMQLYQGNYYYFNNNMKTGLQVIDGKTYYFNTETGIRMTGFVNVSGGWRYFGTDGVMKTGWITVSGNKYYMNTTTGVRMTGLQSIGGKKYYFNTNGIMQKNVLQTISGNTYYFGTDGKAVTGFMTVNGVNYYFDTNGVSTTNVPQSVCVNEVVRLINVERAKAGLPALTQVSQINTCAQIRANEIVTTFSHTRPNGSKCFTALRENEVYYNAAAENIAAGQKLPADVVASWMKSSTHKANILSTKYTMTGIGYVRDSNGVAYWTEFFVG